MTPAQARRELGNIEAVGSPAFWLLFFALATFMLSSFFLVRYFTGGVVNPLLWNLENWINAISAIGIAAALAAAKHMALGARASALLRGVGGLVIVLVFANFGLFTEMSQSMEREGHTVKERSEASPVFRSALAAIEASAHTSAAATGYEGAVAEAQGKAAAHQAKAAECATKYIGAPRIRKCEEYERSKAAEFSQQATSYTAAAATSAGNRNSNTQNLIGAAGKLEFNEDRHYEMIKFFRDALGIAAISASFLFSFVIMGTFELGHWYVGNHVSVLKGYMLENLESFAPEGVLARPAPILSTPPGSAAITTPSGNNLLGSLKHSVKTGAGDYLDKAARGTGAMAAALNTTPKTALQAGITRPMTCPTGSDAAPPTPGNLSGQVIYAGADMIKNSGDLSDRLADLKEKLAKQEAELAARGRAEADLSDRLAAEKAKSGNLSDRLAAEKIRAEREAQAAIQAAERRGREAAEAKAQATLEAERAAAEAERAAIERAAELGKITEDQILIATAALRSAIQAGRLANPLGFSSCKEILKEAGLSNATDELKKLMKLGFGGLSGTLVEPNPNPGIGKPEYVLMT